MNKLLLLLTISIDELFKRMNQQSIKRQQTIKPKENDSLQTMLQTDDNGYILGGWSDTKPSEKKARKNSKKKYYWLMKINSSGIVEWENCIKRYKNDTLIFMSQTTDYGIILKGTTFKNNTNKSSNWLIKLDASGKILWHNHSPLIILPEINPPVQAF